MLRGPENVGAEFETPKASSGKGNGEGVSPSPTDYGVWGSVVSSPSGVPVGQSPGRKRILVHFELEKNESGDDKFDIFCHSYSAYLDSSLQEIFVSFAGGGG